MSKLFEELDRQTTPMGEISVRRRLDPVLRVDVYEVKLGDEHLMSNVFTAAEIALADLALDQVDGTDLDIVIGGLGLGYTARAALTDDRVWSVEVVEALPAVVDWHRRGLVPGGTELVGDPRCQLIEGDFFAHVADGTPFRPDSPDRYDVVLLDVDHTPSHVLHPSHSAFYGSDGLRRVGERIRPGGVFALWSDQPDDTFLATARAVFASCDAHEVRFPNHHTGGEATNTIYLARTAS
ncbi:MAG: spermidine synthase [Acidimicrobiales bacterium]|nr:spermidine synthase [Acidimicrobiales bacterium]